MNTASADPSPIQMTSPQLPRNVLDFLVAHIDHRVKLDFVLFLHRANAVTPVWIAASELELSKAQVRNMADELARDGILRFVADNIELAPRSVETRLAILDLSTWCQLDRTRVHHLLASLGRGV